MNWPPDPKRGRPADGSLTPAQREALVLAVRHARQWALVVDAVVVKEVRR